MTNARIRPTDDEGRAALEQLLNAPGDPAVQATLAAWTMALLDERAKEVRCTKCGDGCCDYKQRGNALLCICCVEDEARADAKAARKAEAAAYADRDTARRHNSSILAAVDDFTTVLDHYLCHAVANEGLAGGSAALHNALAIVQSAEVGSLDGAFLHEQAAAIREGKDPEEPGSATDCDDDAACTHPAAGGPCMPRTSDGRCTWCERELPAAGRRADCDDGDACTTEADDEA